MSIFSVTTGTEFTGFGFAVGSVFGLRSFSVDTLGRLKAVNFDTIWSPGEQQYVCEKDGQVLRLRPPSIFSAFHYPPGYMRAIGYPEYEPEAIQKQAEALPEPFKCGGIEACECGFYAYFGGHNSRYVNRETIEGVVEAYGKVVMGSKGFRAEKARIVAVCVPPERETKPLLKGKAVAAATAVRLRRNYSDVPVFGSVQQMLDEFPLTETDEPTPDNDPDFWTRKATA